MTIISSHADKEIDWPSLREFGQAGGRGLPHRRVTYGVYLIQNSSCGNSRLTWKFKVNCSVRAENCRYSIHSPESEVSRE